jgi:hypothetical protein
MSAAARELKFVATPDKGAVSALLLRPGVASHLLVLGHGARQRRVLGGRHAGAGASSSPAGSLSRPCCPPVRAGTSFDTPCEM